MGETVKKVFDEECAHLRIDSKFIKLLNSYPTAFVNKNEEHMTFFGGNLTGVQVVRFTAADKDKWFSDILDVSELVLEERIEQIPSINQAFHISSDTLNLSVAWLIHAIMTSPHLTDEQKHTACIDASLVLQYKFLTSLLFQYFKYPADPQVAAATYAGLSFKFAIKQYGSWQATLEARCEDLISTKSIHYDTFKRFNNDISIVYLLNDTQGRIRDILKNIYGEFLKTHRSGERIATSNVMIEIDGEMILRDKTKNLLGYTRYVHSIIGDTHSFVKDELLAVINNIMATMPPKLLVQTLEWSSKNYRKVKEIEELVDTTLTHSFSYLSNNKSLLNDTKDLSELLSKLRGVYMSSRSTDASLIEMRRLGEIIIKQSTNTKNESVIASVRTGLLLYLVLRAYTMRFYSNR